MLERAASNVMSPTPISPPLTLQAALAMDGALVCTRAVYRKRAKRGGGAIVNQSSTAAWLYSN